MPNMTDPILIVLLLANFFILGTANLRASIRAVALQGLLLGFLSLGAESEATLRLVLLILVTVAVKTFVIPTMLLRAIRHVHIRHDVEPYLGFVPSLLLCVAGTGLALLYSDRLPLALADRGTMFVPASLATIFSGFLVLTTRRKAITQVVGYLMLENGVYVFGLLLYQSMIVEVGILLDLLVGIFVMGIVLNHIQREFSSLDTERLSRLREER